MSMDSKISNIIKIVFLVILVFSVQPLIYGADFTNVIKEGYDENIDINYELHKNLNVEMDVESFEFENLEIGASDEGITNLVYDVPIKINVKIRRGNTVVVKEYVTKVSMNDIYLDVDGKPTEPESENKSQEVNDDILGGDGSSSSGGGGSSSGGGGSSGGSSSSGVQTGVVSFSKPTSLSYKEMIDKQDLDGSSSFNDIGENEYKSSNEELSDEFDKLNKENDKVQGVLAKELNDVEINQDGMRGFEILYFVLGALSALFLLWKRGTVVSLILSRKKRTAAVSGSSKRENTFVNYEDIF